MAISSKANPEMKKELLRFQIKQLRSERAAMATEGLLVAMLSTMTAIFLPDMLFRLVFSNNKNLTEVPAVLNYIPYVAYGFAVLWGLWVFASSILRQKMVKQLTAQMEQLSK